MVLLNQHIVVEELDNQITKPVSEILKSDLKENQTNADSNTTTLRFGIDGKETFSMQMRAVKNNFSKEDEELLYKVINLEPRQDQALMTRGGSEEPLKTGKELPKMNEEEISLIQSVIKKVIQARQQDFKIILSSKTPNSYVFTSEFRPNRMLRRETMSRDINKRIKSVSSQLPHKISITTHSFRVGDITQLWEDSRDIELVRQSIYLQRFDTTSTYVS